MCRFCPVQTAASSLIGQTSGMRPPLTTNTYTHMCDTEVNNMWFQSENTTCATPDGICNTRLWLCVGSVFLVMQNMERACEEEHPGQEEKRPWMLQSRIILEKSSRFGWVSCSRVKFIQHAKDHPVNLAGTLTWMRILHNLWIFYLFEEWLDKLEKWGCSNILYTTEPACSKETWSKVWTYSGQLRCQRRTLWQRGWPLWFAMSHNLEGTKQSGLESLQSS